MCSKKVTFSTLLKEDDRIALLCVLNDLFTIKIPAHLRSEFHNCDCPALKLFAFQYIENLIKRAYCDFLNSRGDVVYYTRFKNQEWNKNLLTKDAKKECESIIYNRIHNLALVDLLKNAIRIVHENGQEFLRIFTIDVTLDQKIQYSKSSKKPKPGSWESIPEENRPGLWEYTLESLNTSNIKARIICTVNETKVDKIRVGDHHVTKVAKSAKIATNMFPQTDDPYAGTDRESESVHDDASSDSSERMEFPFRTGGNLMATESPEDVNVSSVSIEVKDASSASDAAPILQHVTEIMQQHVRQGKGNVRIHSKSQQITEDYARGIIEQVLSFSDADSAEDEKKTFKVSLKDENGGIVGCYTVSHAVNEMIKSTVKTLDFIKVFITSIHIFYDNNSQVVGVSPFNVTHIVKDNNYLLVCDLDLRAENMQQIKVGKTKKFSGSGRGDTPKGAENAPPVAGKEVTPPPAIKDIKISLNLENKNDKLEDEKDKQDATTGAMGILNGAAKSMRESFASTVKPGGTFEVASEHLTPETVTKAIKSSFSFAQSTEKNKFILSFADDTAAPLTVTENVKKEIDRIVEGPKFVNAVSETVLFDKAYLKDGKRRVFFPEVAVSLDKDDGENHFLKCTVDRANAQSILVDADRIEMVNEQGKRSERKKQEATIADRVVVFLQSLLVTVLALFIFFIQFLYIFKIIIKQNKTLSIKSLIKLFVKESAIVGINLGGSVAGVFINPFRSGDKVAVYKKQGLRGYFKGGFVEMESEATQDIMKELIISYGKINDEKLNDKEKKQIWDKLNRFVMAICDNIESIQKDTNKIFKDIYGFEQFNANMTRVLGVLTELKSKCFDVKDKDSVRSEDLSKYMYEGFGVNSDESFEKVLTHGGLWDNMKHVLDPAAHKLFSFCNFDLMKKGNEGQNVEQGQSANQPQVSSGTDIPHDIKVDSTTQEQPVSRNRRQG